MTRGGIIGGTLLKPVDITAGAIAAAALGALGPTVITLMRKHASATADRGAS